MNRRARLLIWSAIVICSAIACGAIACATPDRGPVDLTEPS
jgi:hypothetical protein